MTEEAHAHEHYNYFRSMMENRYDKELNMLLERVLNFFDNIKGVPVLLSLLIVIFSENVHLKDLPHSHVLSSL